MVKDARINYYEYLRNRVKRYEELFKKFIDNIVQLLGNKVTIILFGSRASGENMESSDFDLMIIVENDADRLSLMEKLYELKPEGVPIDIVVIKKKELEIGTIKKMLKNRRIIHDGLGIFT